MVKTKTTPRRSDEQGNLPPLAPRRRQEGWGTAAETFHRRFQLPQDPVRQDVSYKGMSDRSNRINIILYLLYCISCRTSHIVMLLFMQGWWPKALAKERGTTSPRPVAGGGGLGHRPCVKSVKQCSPLIFAFHGCLSFGMYIDYVNCTI